MVTPIACVSMPLPTQIGVDEAATFCGTSVGVRAKVDGEEVDGEEVEGSEERRVEMRAGVDEGRVREDGEAGGTVVVVS